MRALIAWLLDPLYRWITDYLGSTGLMLYGGGKGSTPPPPDYGPMAKASERAAELGKELGDAQLAEAMRQYDLNMDVIRPIVEAQAGIMQQGIQQGQDYYDYMRSFRPLEQQMLAESAAGTDAANAAERDQLTQDALQRAQELRDRAMGFESDVGQDIATATGGTQGIMDRFGNEIRADVGQAVADTRVGQTSALNQAIRQGLRYGATIPADATTLTNQNAAQLAAAANTARTGAVANYRNLLAQGIGLKQGAFVTGQGALTDASNMATNAASAGRNMQLQDQSLDWARKLDVAGIARGLPGASAGAYGMATQAGNAAAGSQMAPGNSLLGAMGQAAGTTMAGQQQAIGGLGAILSSQTSSYNAGLQQDDGLFGALGTIAGAGITAF